VFFHNPLSYKLGNTDKKVYIEVTAAAKVQQLNCSHGTSFQRWTFYNVSKVSCYHPVATFIKKQATISLSVLIVY